MTFAQCCMCNITLNSIVFIIQFLWVCAITVNTHTQTQVLNAMELYHPFTADILISCVKSIPVPVHPGLK